MHSGLSSLCVLIVVFSSSGTARTQVSGAQSSPAANSPWRLTPRHDVAVGLISGVVKTPDDQGVSYATVSIQGAGTPVVTTTTREDGRFELPNVPSGHYEVTASHELLQSRAEVDVTAGTSWVTLTVPASAEHGSSQAVVSVQQLAVPGKARNELQKARDSIRQKKWSDAAVHIEKALRLWPRYAAALVCRAGLDLIRDVPELAQADAEKAIEYDPKEGEAYIVLGSTYNRLQRWDDALRTLSYGVALVHSWPGYYEISKALLAKGKFPEALQQADKASTMVPANYGPLHVVKGYAYLGLGDNVAASQELETYLRMQPDGEMVTEVRRKLDQLRTCALENHNCRKSISP